MKSIICLFIISIFVNEGSGLNTTSNDTSPFFNDFHPLEEIYDFMKNLTVKYPLLATVKSIGRTHEGREILVIEVNTTNNNNNNTAPTNATVFECGIHAREWIAPPSCLYI